MRNSRIYLDDIIDAMEKIEVFTAGLSFEEFRSDEKTISAVRDKLIVIGEAAKKTCRFHDYMKQEERGVNGSHHRIMSSLDQ